MSKNFVNENLIAIGTIVAVNNAKTLVQVEIDTRVTHWLPVVSISNSFKKHFIPVRVGEECIVFNPMADENSAFVIRSFFNTKFKEPNGHDDFTEVIEFEDGTRVKYSTKTSTLDIDCKGEINIKAPVVNIIGDLKVDGQIYDNVGNLTTHTHKNSVVKR